MDAGGLGRKRSWLVALLAVITLLIAGCGGADDPATDAGDDATDEDGEEVVANEEADESAEDDADIMSALDERATVRVGAVRVVNLAPVWLLQDKAEEYNIEVEFVEFGRFADARTALAADEIDFTAFGPQDIALALAEGSDNLFGLAGAGTGNDALTVSPDAGIEEWDDLAGRSVGIGAGSISWVKFAASLQEQGVDYGGLDIVNVAGGGTAYLQALERGDIEAAVLWEPFSAQAEAEGIGIYPPFSHNESEIVGGQFAVFTTTERNIDERPEVVQRMVNAYVDAMEELTADRERWIDVAQGYAELDDEVIRTAISRSELGYELDLARILNIAEFLVDNGIVSDIDMDRLAAAHDYSYLSARTGQSPEELGATPSP